jgi:hypothetical protein
MQRLWFFVMLALAFGRANGQTGGAALGLPRLHAVRSATPGPAYGCGQHPSQGHGSAVLFLSNYNTKRNSPELQFNSACGAPNYFYVNMAGDDMSLIADLGEAPLQEITASRVFNYSGAQGSTAYTKFAFMAKVEAKHTYAVLINQTAAAYWCSPWMHIPGSRSADQVRGKGLRSSHRNRTVARLRVEHGARSRAALEIR